MLEKLEYCPLCNNGQFTKYLTCKDYTVSKENFHLLQCDSCRLVFTNPRPREADLPGYYQSQDYVSHSDKSNNPINFIYKIARSFTIKSKVNLLDNLTDKGTILDIGCGTGHFLSACRSKGWAITGVEPDPQAREAAASKTAQNIYSDIREIKNQQFDVITLWHVLEHVPNLEQFMKELVAHLSDTGIMIVAVPNYRSYDAKYYQEYWAAYDVPRHLYHFEQATINALMSKHQLSVNGIKPMPLDAYYVSLLSETYKNNGIEKYFNALQNGYRSNQYATNNQNNYSSLIYIISK